MNVKSRNFLLASMCLFSTVWAGHEADEELLNPGSSSGIIYDKKLAKQTKSLFGKSKRIGSTEKAFEIILRDESNVELLNTWYKIHRKQIKVTDRTEPNSMDKFKYRILRQKMPQEIMTKDAFKSFDAKYQTTFSEIFNMNSFQCAVNSIQIFEAMSEYKSQGLYLYHLSVNKLGKSNLNIGQ